LAPDAAASAVPAQVHEPGEAVDPADPDATPTTAAPAPEPPPCLCPGWTRQVDLPLDGEMVNLIWEGPADLGVQPRSHGPDGWSDWADAHLDPDEAPDEGVEGPAGDRHVIGPVWTGPGTDRVEVYLESGTPRTLELEVLHSVVPEGWDPGDPTPAPADAIG